VIRRLCPGATGLRLVGSCWRTLAGRFPDDLSIGARPAAVEPARSATTRARAVAAGSRSESGIEVPALIGPGEAGQTARFWAPGTHPSARHPTTGGPDFDVLLTRGLALRLADRLEFADRFLLVHAPPLDPPSVSPSRTAPLFVVGSLATFGTKAGTGGR
jgi:hypothetical protein